MIIQANPSGTRTIEVTDEHMQTIRQYSLLSDIILSRAIIDEELLNKLRLNCRSTLSMQDIPDKNFMNLCLDVIYNKNMKAFGLNNLCRYYQKWIEEHHEADVSAD